MSTHTDKDTQSGGEASISRIANDSRTAEEKQAWMTAHLNARREETLQRRRQPLTAEQELERKQRLSEAKEYRKYCTYIDPANPDKPIHHKCPWIASVLMPQPECQSVDCPAKRGLKSIGQLEIEKQYGPLPPPVQWPPVPFEEIACIIDGNGKHITDQGVIRLMLNCTPGWRRQEIVSRGSLPVCSLHCGNH